ncbi:polysaccharide biosynthesis/export family protein [Lutibaculum baratangense]|uniref:Periplasmic protein involved in polysaccharide export n=1 Tax=Lutibaculum baratangense AMV1 TaxID=631454 RepID=V4RB51_9HYPH|nr:polysaccharide biosynthesis/export family protein [Lutibaculum baratangense]ESR22634.1 Periplasmic protein involved in polysaccharide export [Lutibaculum baratangense AMV1]
MMPNRVVVLAAALMLGGCSAFPSQGPSAGAIESGAGVQDPQWLEAGYLLVPVNQRTLAYAAAEGRPSFRRIAALSLPAEQGIGVGDVVSVAIFEAGVGGLFSSVSVDGASSSSSTRLPDQQVTRDGSITIPYAGRLSVAGLTPSQVEARIVQALGQRAVEPQAVVSVVQGTSTSVSVTGDAVAGSAIPIPANGLRLLDLIARAGGPTAPVYETAVALTRGGQTVQIPFTELVSNPSENVYVKPGDAVLLTRQPRTFVALGATGANTQLPIKGYEMTVAEALADVGGLNPSQANATGVFLLRQVPESEARAMFPGDAIAAQGPTVSVIYRFDMSQPTGLIYAQRFNVRSGDMLYVATAAFASVRNALSIFQGVASPVMSTAATAASF